MQPIVDAGLTGTLGEPRFQSLAHSVAHGLQRKVDHRSGPTNRGGDGAGAVIIRRYGAPEWHIQMRMNVDSAGHHQQAGSVHHRMPSGGNVGGDARNRFALEQDIGALLAISVDHGAILDQGRHGRVA